MSQWLFSTDLPPGEALNGATDRKSVSCTKDVSLEEHLRVKSSLNSKMRVINPKILIHESSYHPKHYGFSTSVHLKADPT